MLCILAGIYKLISKTVPIIDFYDIDDVLYWFKYIYIYIFICVVKTHLCSTEAIDNVARQTVQVTIINYLTNLKHQNMI